MQINNLEIKPLKGNCENFYKEVKKLQRPYIEISTEEYSELMDQSSDYYLYGDKVVTFGNADGKFALMPLQSKFANKILENNNQV